MTDRPEHADPDRYIELASFDTGFRDLWWNPDFLALGARRFGIAAAERVLDVGCGAGEWGRIVVRHMAPRAALTGVDRVPQFVELAGKHARPGDAFVVGSAEALPFDDDAFDVVTCQTVLMHVADAAKVVAEMARVTRPGGTVLLAEPDNLAGNLALVGGQPCLPDEDVLALTRLLLACHRGKAALGEGDERVGARLPGLLDAAGLGDVACYTNDRCISLYPPYGTPTMKLALSEERRWNAEDVTILLASRPDAARLARAGELGDADFDRSWQAVRRWMRLVEDGVDAGTYHAARGFVMYLAAGRKPTS